MTLQVLVDALQCVVDFADLGPPPGRELHHPAQLVRVDAGREGQLDLAELVLLAFRDRNGHDKALGIGVGLSAARTELRLQPSDRGVHREYVELEKFEQPTLGVRLADRDLVELPLQVESGNDTGVLKLDEGDRPDSLLGLEEHLKLVGRPGIQASDDLRFLAHRTPIVLQHVSDAPNHQPGGWNFGAEQGYLFPQRGGELLLGDTETLEAHWVQLDDLRDSVGNRVSVVLGPPAKLP